MKLKGYISFILAVLLLSSCLVESLGTTEEVLLETNGVIKIGVKAQSADPADQIKTIRFIVFKDIATSPKVDINDLWDETDIAAENPGMDEASELTALLQVSRRTSGSNMKRVFAIVNEPSQLTTALNGVTNYNDLENLQLDFAHFLNPTHTGLLASGKGLPMTGMVETNKVYETVAEAEADREELTLERAVARVDVYIRKEAGVAVDLRQGSTITLENSYDKSYFIRNEIAPNTNIFFGQIQTVLSGFKDYTFTQTTTKTIPVVSSGNDGELICSFYTPERTCIAPADADKLNVKLNILSTDGDNRSGEVLLDTATREGESASTPLTEIRRNNSYKIIARVENKSAQIKFTIVYVPWEMIDQSIIFD